MKHSAGRRVESRDPGNTRTILVADDERGVTGMIEALLSQQGYRVFVAHDGRAGLELFKEHGCFDLIITDIVMPGMTGPAMLEEIGRNCPRTRAILISGYSEEATLQGVNGRGWVLLQKPFGLSELLSAVRASLSELSPEPGA